MGRSQSTVVVLTLVATSGIMTATPAATACERLQAGGIPVETRKPVHGSHVRLIGGFGIRRHPLLNESRQHRGIDWSAPTGTEVYSAGKGEVVSAEHAGAYGNRIIVDHGDGWQTLYAQLSGFFARVGDCVDPNTKIGVVGSTGLAAEPHLHFEILRGGEPVDPMQVPIGQTILPEE
jgi:murein DD-endopeptidase MepM/ murein hydrolase activator NlpD